MLRFVSAPLVTKPHAAIRLRHDRPELETFCGEINGGASIGATVLFQFINLAVEQTPPWMGLRYNDTSKSVAAGNTRQTTIGL